MSMRKDESERSVSASITLPVLLYARLHGRAAETHRSLSHLVREAVEAHLAEDQAASASGNSG